MRRQLYSNADLTVFAFRRVVLLNGIDLGASRDDLAERLLTIELHRITHRRYDADITSDWAQAHPRILGALLDLAVRVLAELPRTRLHEPPRMADFARVLAALDTTLGTTGLATYTALAGDLAADAVTGDPVLSALVEAITVPWTGTAAELLPVLGDGPEHGKAWPKDARAMTVILRRRAPALRRLGWTVDDLGRQGKANAVRFLIQPPSSGGQASDSTPEASDSTPEASDSTPEASDSNRDARQLTPPPTSENTEKASEASDASDKYNLLGTCPYEKREREAPTEATDPPIVRSPDSSLASLASLADTLADLGGTCPRCRRFICECEEREAS